jgi:hypothetical protein
MSKASNQNVNVLSLLLMHVVDGKERQTKQEGIDY